MRSFRASNLGDSKTREGRGKEGKKERERANVRPLDCRRKERGSRG